ncbi:Rhodanese-like protein [Ilyonectria robusta]
MASRRPLAVSASALRAASVSALRPATPVFAAATRAYALRPAVKQQSRLLAPAAAGLRRWYSVSKDDLEPGRHLWQFDELKALVEKNKGKDGETVIVDVREPVELFETGKIPGAINIPITSAVQSFHISDEDFQVAYGFDRPAKDVELLIYCKAGVRARAAAALARQAGWENVGEYPGSWLDWEAQNGPVEKV